MLNIKTLNEVIINIINNIHDALPEIDIKEGTFVRDVIIDPIANEVADIYNDLYGLQVSQSVLTATGSDLDRLAANYFITRKAGTISSGKVRFYIKRSNLDSTQIAYSNIRIPKGTTISGQGTTKNPSLQFVTVDDILIPASSNSITSNNVTVTTGVLALPRDATGFRYVEIACQSLSIGSGMNIAPNIITSQVGTTIDMISSVNNPYSFSGGSDPEDDISLALRISLAITGSNIGTKDGYTSYILKQPQVLDAYVVGAGDSYMTRDIVTILDPKTNLGKQQSIGGKVDIYVKTNSLSEDSFSHQVNADDLNNDFKVPTCIYFPSSAYPIDSLESITGQSSTPDGSAVYKTYINAEQYDLEKTTSSNTDLNYYVDFKWDFSIKTIFPDTDYYPLPLNLTSDDIFRLKTKIDNELQLASNYLNNISYKIDWDLINWVNPTVTATSFTTLFDYGQYMVNSDGQFYKLKVNASSGDAVSLGGRVFIKKGDDIYVRAYVTPDFRLVRDSSDVQGSVRALDYISWFENSGNLNDTNSVHVPNLNEVLTIKYTYNSGIKDLQTGLETKRVMTADVLVKSAKQRDVEIKLSVRCSASYDSTTVKQTINNALAYYVNSNKKLGGYLNESDIIYIVKSIDGIISVDVNSSGDNATLGLGFVQNPYAQTITCNPDEYFSLANSIITVTNTLSV